MKKEINRKGFCLLAFGLFWRVCFAFDVIDEAGRYWIWEHQDTTDSSEATGERAQEAATSLTRNLF